MGYETTVCTAADRRYNGWSNYATWRVNLELCDDIASNLVGEQTFESVEDLADFLRNEVEEFVSGDWDGSSRDDSQLIGIIRGYAQAFIDDVDWLEIAEADRDELVREGGD